MEAQRQLVHVHEGLEGELAHRILADAGKQRVAQLVERQLDQPRQVIGDDQRDGAGQQRRKTGVEIGLAVQRIGRPLEEVGDEQQYELGNEEVNRSPDDPHLEIRATCWPHVGPQIEQRPQEVGIRDCLVVCHANLPPKGADGAALPTNLGAAEMPKGARRT